MGQYHLLKSVPSVPSTQIYSSCVPRNLPDTPKPQNGSHFHRYPKVAFGGDYAAWPGDTGVVWEIRCFSLSAKKSCNSNDDTMNRIYGLSCIYPLPLLSSTSKLAKLPSAIASVKPLKHNFKIRPCVCKSSVMQVVPSGLDLFGTKSTYLWNWRERHQKKKRGGGICVRIYSSWHKRRVSNIPVHQDNAAQCIWSLYGSKVLSEREKRRALCKSLFGFCNILTRYKYAWWRDGFLWVIIKFRTWVLKCILKTHT